MKKIIFLTIILMGVFISPTISQKKDFFLNTRILAEKLPNNFSKVIIYQTRDSILVRDSVFKKERKILHHPDVLIQVDSIYDTIFVPSGVLKKMFKIKQAYLNPDKKVLVTFKKRKEIKRPWRYLGFYNQKTIIYDSTQFVYNDFTKQVDVIQITKEDFVSHLHYVLIIAWLFFIIGCFLFFLTRHESKLELEQNEMPTIIFSILYIISIFIIICSKSILFLISFLIILMIVKRKKILLDLKKFQEEIKKK
jgi:membrane-associated HD superfamily phosphohydrolase